MLYLTIGTIHSNSSLELQQSECDWENCVCCSGNPKFGGKMTNFFEICEHFCMKGSDGNTFCGDGWRYAQGHDCRNCAQPFTLKDE